jgi:spore coat protein U-like protein
MRALILCLLVWALTLPAMSQTTAAKRLPGSCLVRDLPMLFGRYSIFQRTPEISTARIEVLCPGGTSVSRVMLSSGASSDVTDRAMETSTGVLHYNLYVDPGRQRVAGDGTGGSLVLTPRTRNAGGLTVFPIYGVIAPGQIVPAGRYSDNISIIVEF